MGLLISDEEVEGWGAYDEGRPRADNPYITGTKEHEDWDCGWTDRCEGN